MVDLVNLKKLKEEDRVVTNHRAVVTDHIVGPEKEIRKNQINIAVNADGFERVNIINAK